MKYLPKALCCLPFALVAQISIAQACSCLPAESFSDLVSKKNKIFEGVVTHRKRTASETTYTLKTCSGRKTVKLVTPASESLCGQRLKVGKKTIVAATLWKGRYRTTLCHAASLQKFKTRARSYLASSRQNGC